MIPWRKPQSFCGWDVETALSESRHVESDADCYRFNGYGHLEAVSNESLLEDARDNIDDIIDWLESAFLHDLWDNPEMCSRPRFAEKALDMPTEEYIMYHDGVKTEFQITEVKKDSFAYEQGARYDAKVLTNGHDCGNGRFCADLDEAHEFCQQFADSVVGLGESLDDMCEDRRKVASLAQDVDADNRDQEYNNHDNSEIGE